MVITVLADGLAPNGARPSASTVLTKILDIFSSKFLQLRMILYDLYGQYDDLQNASQKLVMNHNN